MYLATAAKIKYPALWDGVFDFKRGYNEEKAQLESLKKIQRNYDMSFEVS